MGAMALSAVAAALSACSGGGQLFLELAMWSKGDHDRGCGALKLRADAAKSLAALREWHDASHAFVHSRSPSSPLQDSSLKQILQRPDQTIPQRIRLQHLCSVALRQ